MELPPPRKLRFESVGMEIRIGEGMKKIIIVLEITDPETVEAYWDTDKEIIFDDLQNGLLLEMCDLVKLERAK